MGDNGEGAGEACVLLTCREGETWVVPQVVIAALLHRSSPAASVHWHGQTLPVLDRDPDCPPGFTGPALGEVLAVFRGGPRAPVPFWALRLRAPGARWAWLTPDSIRDCPESVQVDALAALEYQGEICQVPDLADLEARM